MAENTYYQHPLQHKHHFLWKFRLSMAGKKGCFSHSAHYLGRDFSTKLIKKGAKWFNNDSAHWRRGHNLIKKGCKIIIPRHHEAPLHCCSLCAHSFLNDTCPHCYKKKHGACILHGPFVNHEILSISLKFKKKCCLLTDDFKT